MTHLECCCNKFLLGLVFSTPPEYNKNVILKHINPYKSVIEVAYGKIDIKKSGGMEGFKV